MLQQKAYSATKELEMLKMDHSELIRNTNFTDQREQIELYATAQLQVEHLTALIKE